MSDSKELSNVIIEKIKEIGFIPVATTAVNVCQYPYLNLEEEVSEEKAFGNNVTSRTFSNIQEQPSVEFKKLTLKPQTQIITCRRNTLSAMAALTQIKDLDKTWNIDVKAMLKNTLINEYIKEQLPEADVVPQPMGSMRIRGKLS